MTRKLWEIDPELYEESRLRALAAYKILDSEQDVAFDRITKLASDIFNVPIAMVSLIDQKRQWFKSAFGTDIKQTPREISFCTHALRRTDPLVILDTHKDSNFANNPLVTGSPFIRFYVGAPLLTTDGFVLGTLCILDVEPRAAITVEDLQRLSDLADIVMSELELRKSVRQCDEVSEMLDSALDFAKIAIWELDIKTDRIRWQGDCGSVWGNDTKTALLSSKAAFGRILVEDHDQVQSALNTAIENNTPYNTSFRINHPELGIRWISGRGHQVISDGQLVVRGINFDITDVKDREQMSSLLTRELHHRMRNLFATVRAIISLTKSSALSVDDYAHRIENRLLALDRAQHVLLNSNFMNATLHALMREISDSFPRINWNGPDEKVPENILVALALVLYELATNAAKHGGLSVKTGSVKLGWSFGNHENMEFITFAWEEHGGNSIGTAPTSSGFGTQLIERSVRDNLKGVIERQWTAAGLVCKITIPVTWRPI